MNPRSGVARLSTDLFGRIERARIHIACLDADESVLI